jgi:hypothetical protein
MNNVVLIRMREAHAIVGVVEDKRDGKIYLSKVGKVRYWGTTKGFEELCGGPTPKTIVDVAKMPRGTLAVVHEAQVIYEIPADPKWEDLL